ncbi:sulfite exporter TauE/SafE family protein [Promicromonospora kroppenstedtii]|uniref:sulfite exporter TauE/SafE family protein n=1 Tax=Promicromonospora kroppenstedtii TaxID=440482 RepID=UPI0004AE3D57|nr:sulfite exporter TauE/SafE family protein [Promicromonospora kroppenstedtii]
MSIELPLVLGGLVVGFIVGLTGMGGGALMTPMLIFVFRVDPLVAVSSDVVASLFMKPAGAIVHLRRGTVHLKLVLWLCVGSVPAAFSGALLIQALPFGDSLDAALKTVLGVALLIASGGLVVRAVLQMVRTRSALGEGPTRPSAPEMVVRPVPTAILGAVAGLLVGMTSVGAGSVVIVVLLLLYPALKASQLVGTDLVQAVPLVAAASLGHLLYGDFSLGLTTSLLIGAIPGAWFGAHVSSRAPGGIIRRALAILLLASALKLLGASLPVVLGAAGAALVLGNLVWFWVKRRFSATAQAPEADSNRREPAPDRPDGPPDDPVTGPADGTDPAESSSRR